MFVDYLWLQVYLELSNETPKTSTRMTQIHPCVCYVSNGHLRQERPVVSGSHPIPSLTVAIPYRHRPRIAFTTTPAAIPQPPSSPFWRQPPLLLTMIHIRDGQLLHTAHGCTAHEYEEFCRLYLAGEVKLSLPCVSRFRAGNHLSNTLYVPMVGLVSDFIPAIQSHLYYHVQALWLEAEDNLIKVGLDNSNNSYRIRSELDALGSGNIAMELVGEGRMELVGRPW